MKALDLGLAAVQLKDRTPVELPEGDVLSASDAAGRQQSRWRVRLADVDRHVSRRIRERRIAVGLTQHQLATLIEVSYQQFHKYEVGANRLSAGRLGAIAQALGVEVGHFFIGLAGPVSDAHDLTLELSRAFVRIPDKRHQELVCLIARMLASEARK